MWSGPRTRSTALMRAWENRGDTTVVDEPLYAYYLAHTDATDPGRDEVIAAYPTDWRQVASELTGGTLPEGSTIHYQKHLAQHLLPEVDRTAFEGLRHAFLVRHPAQMLASYAKVQAPTVEELGLRQQLELFERFGGPVIDSNELVSAPSSVLQALCAALDVPFTDRMLSWPAGRRATDGNWGSHWYHGVWQSTGFAEGQTPTAPLPDHLRRVLDECMPLYEQLARYVLPVLPADTGATVPAARPAPALASKGSETA
ncbi:hypothetical protein ACE1OC_00440 [Streptomyces sp. DSM 116496]|uniref:sulfotransferase-like domain-containing protein n=1 Tax=Streptomyces stoeckheimensis TaxID=3344656 RepID=UPI0038B37CFB